MKTIVTAFLSILVGLFIGLGIGYFVFNRGSGLIPNELVPVNEIPIIPNVGELISNPLEQMGQKLQTCPQEWIQNNMPMVIDDTKPNELRVQGLDNEYFILNGERKELEECDIDWIKQNCNLEPTIVW